MSTRYEIWLCNDDGARIAKRNGYVMLDRVQNFTATRITNDVGTFTAIVPSTFDQTLLRRDLIIQVWRAASGAALELFRVYFLRRWTLATKRGKTTIELHGLDPNDLLRRRVIRGAPGTPTTEFQKGEYCDDAMKRMITQAQIDTGGGSHWPATSYGTRAYPNFTVEGDTSTGPTLGERQDFSNEYIFQPDGRGALNDVAEIAAEQDTPIFFDVSPLVLTGKTMTFIFRTKTDQPGQDLTSKGVLFSQDRGNVTECSLTYDYTKEENYIWGVRERGTSDTTIHQDYDRVAHDASIWNRCEGITDLNVMWGKPYLRSKRGKVNFVGTIIDTAGLRYGVDWNFGDRVRVRYQHFQFDAIIRAVTLQIDKRGKESVSARLEYQESA